VTLDFLATRHRIECDGDAGGADVTSAQNAASRAGSRTRQGRECKSKAELHRIFYATRFCRKLGKPGSVRFRQWRMYGERGLARRHATVRLFLETHFPSSQPTLWELDDGEWLKLVRMRPALPRRHRRAAGEQQRLIK